MNPLSHKRTLCIKRMSRDRMEGPNCLNCLTLPLLSKIHFNKAQQELPHLQSMLAKSSIPDTEAKAAAHNKKG